MGAVQTALSTTRQADVRIRKLQEEKAAKDAAWQAYVAKMQRNFAKQKKEYNSDLVRIEKSLEETMAAGGAAAARVQELVLRGAEALEPAAIEPPQDMEWDAIVAGSGEEETGFSLLHCG